MRQKKIAGFDMRYAKFFQKLLISIKVKKNIKLSPAVDFLREFFHPLIII